MEFRHETVLLREAVDGLCVRPGGVYVDGTLGGAGHSLEIAKRLGPGGRLVGIDRDESAVAAASERLKGYEDRTLLLRGNFSEMDGLLRKAGIEGADGILLDLGTSSPQLDDAARGFSYMTDAPLDMRMDRTSELTAGEIVNVWSREDLKRIFYEYGEERYSGRIAAAIAARREQKPIESTLELVEIIKSAMPAAALREKQHPAKRSFQALRITTNSELQELAEVLETCPELLNRGGRLCVISFHSLEDRIVKEAIRKRERGCTCPRDFPVCVCGFRQSLRAITGKPITPSREELEKNPRARSAKLRIAERV